jgi:hypothetical protein
MLSGELRLSPWGIMAWGATPRSSRLQPGEMSRNSIVPGQWAAHPPGSRHSHPSLALLAHANEAALGVEIPPEAELGSGAMFSSENETVARRCGNPRDVGWSPTEPTDGLAVLTSWYERCSHGSWRGYPWQR